MSDVLNNSEDLTKRMKEGLTFIDDRNSQFRYADKNEFIQWSQPLSSYRAAVPLKRGIAVSVATEEDLKEAGKKYFDDESYFLKDDPYAYVVPTDTSKHTKCIGLVHEPVLEGEIGKKIIHVQGFGSFTYNMDLDKEEIEKGQVYDPGFTYKDVGKKVYVANAEFDGVEPGFLTTNSENIYKTYNNFILLGYLTDAPVKGSTQVETKIEIAIQGDDRGPIDNTIFEGILGEDVLVPSSDPCRVFALGQEEDVAFKSKIIYSVSPNYSYNPKTSFIGFQRMDGDTVLVTFSDEFSIAEVQNSMVQEDASFLAIAKLYNDALNKTKEEDEAEHKIKIIKTDIKNKLADDVLTLTKTNLEKALKDAWSELTGVELKVDTEKSNLKEGILCFDIESSQPGGYYYMYVSSSLLPLFEDSVTIHNGSSLNKGTVVIADCRIRERQNIIGVWYNNKLDEIVPKGTICLFMHDGLFTHETAEYQSLGKEYFLGRNGRVVELPLEAYDTIVKVLDVQDKNKLLIHCDNARRHDDTGDLPVGYMKPATYCGDQPVAEYGFVLMDGVTRYKVSDYKKLVERLKAWFPESKLRIGKERIGEDAEGNPIYEEENHFIVPKSTSSTEYSEYNIMQIKAVEAGIYEFEPRIPYIRKFGTFFDAGENSDIQINGKLKGVAYPQIAKYTVHNPNAATKDKKDYTVDDRFDISAICDLCTKIDGVEDPTLENLDIHLYIDPEYGDSSRKDGLYHWVEIRSGFSSFNNTTTYGFEWKIEKEVANSVNVYSTYYLSTDIKDGMGIYYQTSGNVVPKSMAGKPWKITVSRRETLKQQFDLNGVISAYLKNKILDENGEAYTDKAATGLAVLDAIETRYNVKKLVARKDEGEILLGKESEPTKVVNIAAREELPIKSDDKIRFGIGVPSDGKEKNQHITYEASEIDNGTEIYTIENFIINPSVDEYGNARRVTSIAEMPENALVTKAQVQEHENKNAVNPDLAVKPDTVHGMYFGIGGNIDASKLNNLYLATHSSTQLKTDAVISSDANKTVSNDDTKSSYIPYKYYGDDPLGTGQNYITSNEGIEVHQNASLTGTTIPFYSSEQYKVNETNTVLSHIETIDDHIETFEDIKTIKRSSTKIITKYNFGITDDSNSSISFMDEEGLPITINAAAIGAGSKLDYKTVFGEDKQSLTESGLNNTNGFNYLNNLMKDSTQAEYIGSALQAAYEMPLAFWHYKNEPTWYKKYVGIIIERVNDARDHLSDKDKRGIFSDADLDWGSTKHYTDDNVYNYTDEELKSIKNYLNSITDTAENTQNIISSVGLLLRAAKETQERLLKIEASTFGSDASTIPGAREKIVLDSFPEVTPEATHLGLNRLIRAMSLELYGTADPLNDLNGDKDNSTQTSFSRIDELEKEIEGATFDNTIEASSSDNNITMLDSSTYPYEINDTHKGNDDGTENTTNTTVYDPITGRAKKDSEEETTELHSNWSKVDLEKAQTFEKDGDTFKSNTANNLVPENERYEFNGLIDAIARICTKVNALTYTVNGTDNIDSTPRRLNTIRANIGTLIREAYFDGEPTTKIENDKAITQDEIESERYKDLDIAEGVEQSSKPYEQKTTYTGLSRFDQLSNGLYNYVLTTRHDEHNYTLNGENVTEDGKTSKVNKPIQYRNEENVKQVLLGRKFNGKNLLISGIGASIQEEGKDEYNRTGEITSEDTLVNNVNGADIQNKNVSVQINVPDSIEEYNYASIIDILIDAIGPAYFRQVYDNNDVTLSEQTLRDTRTITTRLEKIEGELDNVVRKLCQKSAFETDTNKSLNDDTISTDYGDDAQDPNKKNKTYSIEEFIFVLNKWLGLSVFGKNDNAWDVQRSAELAAGYDNSIGETYVVNSTGVKENIYTRNPNNGTYELVADPDKLASDIITYIKVQNNNDYLETASPIVNANYVIKQLLKRLRETEHYDDAVRKILGKDYATDTALNNYTELRINADGTQNFENIKHNYTLTDDVKDLLLTIYGTDSDKTGSSENSAGTVQTNYQHRSNIVTANYLGSQEWVNEGKNTPKLYTTLTPKVGDNVYKEDALKNIFGTIKEIKGNAPNYTSIVVSYNDSEAEYNFGKTTSEANDNANTRFSGNSNTRNIIDDIVHEMYYVPQPVNYGDNSLSDETVEQSKKDVNDSINVNYATGNGKNHIYYDIDSGRYNYDYENQSHENTENEGRTGHAIGYNNRNTLFNDFIGNDGSYRKSRFEVLEDEIRHLRSLLGLDKIIDKRTNDKVSDSVASETKYGGKFLITGIGELAGHKFSANATRNGNLYTDNSTSAVSPYNNSSDANQDTNLLTFLFNIDNAIKDISRELGTETNYHGSKESTIKVDGQDKVIDYNKFEQLNLPREMTIYDRLNALEDLTGSLLGLQNRATKAGSGESDSEDDDTTELDFGRIDIQWIEE